MKSGNNIIGEQARHLSSLKNGNVRCIYDT